MKLPPFDSNRPLSDDERALAVAEHDAKQSHFFSTYRLLREMAFSGRLTPSFDERVGQASSAREYVGALLRLTEEVHEVEWAAVKQFHDRRIAIESAPRRGRG